MTEKLKLWEPLLENPFYNLKNQLYFYDISCNRDFILVFEEIESYRLYVFIYEDPKMDNAVISFSFYPSLTRSDMDQLVTNFWEEREVNEADPLPNELTFFKVYNSSWISWYDSVFPAIVHLNPETEHHTYITADYYIHVMSEQEPHVRIMEKHEWEKLRATLSEQAMD